MNNGLEMRKLKAYLQVLVVLVAIFLVFRGSMAAAKMAEEKLFHPPGVLLFIGDGMGVEHRKAGQWAAVGQAGQLAMDTLTVAGWSKTNDAINLTTDSAAAGTAIATGQKTYNGRISMDPAGESLETILEIAQERGWSVGLVTNVQITHATPAVFAAHVMYRKSYTEIALQMHQHKVEVLLGGGENHFLTDTVAGCYPGAGDRTDDRDLVAEAQAAGYTYVCTGAELAAIDLAATDYLLGLFADEGMTRPYSPTLAQMTDAAIQILSKDRDGFFLMVEGGQIDWAGHANDGENVIGDVIGFDQAVTLGLDYAQAHPNTLLIVTADHETGGMSVSMESNGAPGEDGPFYMPDQTPFYIHWSSTGHTSADVRTTAYGRQAEGLAGTEENTHIFTVMRQVVGWEAMLPLVTK